MTSRVTVISQAYTLLGQNGINDLDVGNPRDQYVASLYDYHYPYTLSLRPWSFALTTQKLAKLTAPLDLDDWSFGYQLPTDPRWVSIYRARPNVNFHIYGDELYTNADPFQLDYTFEVDESKLPYSFFTFLLYSFTAKIAMLVTQQPSLVKLWQQEAAVAFSQASLADSRNQPNIGIADQPLYVAHFIDNTNV